MQFTIDVNHSESLEHMLTRARSIIRETHIPLGIGAAVVLRSTQRSSDQPLMELNYSAEMIKSIKAPKDRTSRSFPGLRSLPFWLTNSVPNPDN